MCEYTHFEIIKGDPQIYDLLPIHNDKEFWSESYYHGFVRYLRDTDKIGWYIGEPTNDSMVDFEREKLGYKRDQAYFEQKQVEYRSFLYSTMSKK